MAGDTTEVKDSGSLTNEKLLMTYDEVAEECRCTRRHLYNLVKSGKMPAPTKLGRSVRFQTEVIKKWLKKRGA